EETIAEDGEGEAAEASGTTPGRATARHSRQNSANRLSTISKLSLTPSLSGSEGRVLDDDGNTKSNRSSATIRPNPSPNLTNGTTNGNNTSQDLNGSASPNGGGEGIGFDGLPADFDFDKALLKFAAE